MDSDCFEVWVQTFCLKHLSHSISPASKILLFVSVCCWMFETACLNHLYKIKHFVSKNLNKQTETCHQLNLYENTMHIVNQWSCVTQYIDVHLHTLCVCTRTPCLIRTLDRVPSLFLSSPWYKDTLPKVSILERFYRTHTLPSMHTCSSSSMITHTYYTHRALLENSTTLTKRSWYVFLF